MRMILIALAGASSILLATQAFAACSNPGGAVGGAAAGAAAGAAIGGPAGAAVGGVVGGVVGAKALPPTACSYVITQDVAPVTIQQEVVVGQPLPSAVELHAIPEVPDYRFAYVNDHRVLVNPKTRVVVEVVD